MDVDSQENTLEPLTKQEVRRRANDYNTAAISIAQEYLDIDKMQEKSEMSLDLRYETIQRGVMMSRDLRKKRDLLLERLEGMEFMEQ